MIFSGSGLLLTIFFGAALGNVVRGVPLDASGTFFLPLWTNFQVGGKTGILDWFTILVGITSLFNPHDSWSHLDRNEDRRPDSGAFSTISPSSLVDIGCVDDWAHARHVSRPTPGAKSTAFSAVGSRFPPSSL